MNELRGPRLMLRGWRDDDLDAFAALNADPRVMAFLPARLSRNQSVEMMARMQAHIDANGWGLWAIDFGGRCIGFTGLSRPRFEAHFTPCIEIGWRLAQDTWGHGYATEAARLALHYGFDVLQLSEIVSFTTVANRPSQRVMERIGMRRDAADDFDHPALPGHQLQPHLLYRLSRADFVLRARPL